MASAHGLFETRTLTDEAPDPDRLSANISTKMRYDESQDNSNTALDHTPPHSTPQAKRMAGREYGDVRGQRVDAVIILAKKVSCIPFLSYPDVSHVETTGGPSSPPYLTSERPFTSRNSRDVPAAASPAPPS